MQAEEAEKREMNGSASAEETLKHLLDEVAKVVVGQRPLIETLRRALRNSGIDQTRHRLATAGWPQVRLRAAHLHRSDSD